MTAIHTRVSTRVFTDMEHPHRCWPRDWTRDQCVTVAKLRTGHSPLLAAYLYRIGRRLSHLPTLQWCWRDGRTSGVKLPSTRPGAAGVMAKSPLSKQPKTPMELPGEDRGGDPSPQPGMRERVPAINLWNSLPAFLTSSLSVTHDFPAVS